MKAGGNEKNGGKGENFFDVEVQQTKQREI